MRCFKLMFDDENKSSKNMFLRVEKYFENKYNLNRYSLEKGVRIDKWDEDITFFYNNLEGNESGDLVSNNLLWRILSPKAQQCFLRCNTSNIQLLPITIKEVNSGEILLGYKALNIIGFVDAFDREKSRYTELKADEVVLLSITHYTLLKNRIIGLDCLKIKESANSIFVSEKLRNDFEQVDIVGMDFREISLS